MTIIGFPAPQPEIVKTLKDWPWDTELGKPFTSINGGEQIVQKEDKTNPTHYKHLPVECIELTEHMGFCLGNVIKYVYRCNLKGGVDDLRKARWYLDREIARRGGGEPNDAGC